MMRYSLFAIFLLCTFFSLAQKNRGEFYIQRAYQLSETAPDSAIYFAEQAINFGLVNKDSLITGSGYVQLGSAYRVKGEFESSMEALHLALRILPATQEGFSDKGAVYSSLGNLYYATGQLEKAKKSYLKSFQIKIEVGKILESAIVATQLASIYGIDSTSDSSFIYSRYALEHLNKNDHPIYVANLYNAIGAAYSFNLATLDSSLHYYERAKALFQKSGFKTQVAATQFNIAAVYKERGRLHEAEKVLLSALENLIPGADLHYRLSILTELCYIYEQTGNHTQYVVTDHLKDSVSNVYYSTENSKNLLELEEKYKSAEKDRELRENKIRIQKSELELAGQREKFFRWLIASFIVLGVLSIIFIYIYLKRRNEKQLEREKERFFSNVVHEIRTPLTLISAPIAHLKSGNTDTEAQSKFNLIERNIQRLGALVNQLLDISKIDSKKYKLNYTYGNLDLFLQDLAERAGQLAMEKDMVIQLETENCNQIIQLDYDALEKIVMNLITNAIKYSNAETTVSIMARIENQKLIIAVKDQGQGIPEKLQQQVFSRFDRGENTEPNKGIGIGLSLVLELCQLLKGSIHLTSEVGKGSVFTVEIPVNEALASNHQLAVKQIENTVLLVEDDPDMRSFISELLAQKGFQVISAENGLKALQLLEEQLPALILSDAMMPEMDGYTLVNEIKNTDLYSHIPVVILSAKTSHESKLKGLKSGADFYLEKPFDPDELFLTLKNTIDTITKNQLKFTAQLTNEELTFEERIVSDDPFIRKLNELVLTQLDNADLTVEVLAQDMSISRSQLHRKVKSVSGKSISHYIRIIRLEKAIDMLKKRAGNVSEVAYATGFNSPSYFTRCFTEHFGYPPSQLDNR